jgi:hypothetical protein
MNDLPFEVLEYLASCLNACDICRLNQTCRDLSFFFSSEQVWKKLFVRDWSSYASSLIGTSFAVESWRTTYARFATTCKVQTMGDNEAPADWGVATQPVDMGGGQLGRELGAGMLQIAGVSKVAVGG